MHLLACFIAIIGGLFILWIAGAVLYLQLIRELFLRRIKAQQRVLGWEEVENHLKLGAGTLIIEQKNQVGVRFWWTPDDLVAGAPMPVIRDFDDLSYAYIAGEPSNPFVAWCFENYLSVKNGKAFFTRLEGLRLPPGPVESDYIIRLYPRAKIVQTVLTRLGG